MIYQSRQRIIAYRLNSLQQYHTCKFINNSSVKDDENRAKCKVEREETNFMQHLPHDSNDEK